MTYEYSKNRILHIIELVQDFFHKLPTQTKSNFAYALQDD